MNKLKVLLLSTLMCGTLFVTSAFAATVTGRLTSNNHTDITVLPNDGSPEIWLMTEVMTPTYINITQGIGQYLGAQVIATYTDIFLEQLEAIVITYEGTYIYNDGVTMSIAEADGTVRSWDITDSNSPVGYFNEPIIEGYVEVMCHTILEADGTTSERPYSVTSTAAPPPPPLELQQEVTIASFSVLPNGSGGYDVIGFVAIRSDGTSLTCKDDGDCTYIGLVLTWGDDTYIGSTVLITYYETTIFNEVDLIQVELVSDEEPHPGQGNAYGHYKGKAKGYAYGHDKW